MAMLCIARTMLSPDGCSSVCLSVCHTPVLHVEMAKHIIIFFSPSSSHTIFFHTKHYGNITTETP